jgi:hypothetical protein
MRFFSLFCFVFALLAVNPPPARADNCPDSKTATKPFVVGRGSDWLVAVAHVDDTIVRTMLRSRGTTLLETTLFQGLFQLERLEQGRRKTLQPKSDLKSFFPVKVGKKIVAKFDTEESGKKSDATVELVVRKTDTLYIGACKYNVFQIERNEGRGDNAPRFINNDYYSPDLKMVIAKEYKNTGGATTWIRYNRIYSGDR